MGKYFLLASILVFCAYHATAQQLPNHILKSDSVIYSVDSTFVAYYKNQKNGLYNLKKGTYEFGKKTKSPLIYAPNNNVFLLVRKDQVELYKEKNGELISYSPHNLENKNFNYSILDQEFLVINDLKLPSFTIEKQAFELKKFAGSGVYNLENRKWEILPIKLNIQLVNNWVFCLEADSVYFDTLWNKVGYGSSEEMKVQVAEVANKELIFTKERKWNHPTILKQILEEDSVVVYDDHLAVTYSSIKGYQSRIFDPFNINSKGEILEIINQAFIDKKHQLIISDTSLNLLFTYRINDAVPLKMIDYSKDSLGIIYQGEKNVSIHYDPDMVYTLENEKEAYTYSHYSLVYRQSSPYQLIHSGMEIINDSLIRKIRYAYPAIVEVRDENGKFVYNKKGDIVLKEGSSPWSRGNVYNLNRQKWKLSNNYKEIYPTKSGWLVSKINNSSCSEEKEYIFLDEEEHPISPCLSIEDILRDQTYISDLILECPVDSVYSVPNELGPNEQDEFYFTNDKGIGYVNLNFNARAPLYSLEEPHDFLHEGIDNYYRIFIEDDSLYIAIDKEEVGVQLHGAHIKGSIKLGISDQKYQLTLEDASNKIYTTNTGLKSNENMFQQDEISQLKLEVHGWGEDRLIVNELLVEKGIKELYGSSFSNWGVVEYYEETERSAVYEKEKGKWVRKTPYYAEIYPVAIGYIARTATKEGRVKRNEDGDILYNEKNEMVLQADIESKYILLDTNYKAISVADYFDFYKIENLGFGLSVCIDYGQCMLMDNRGEAVTDFKWHDFELEDGQIKALKYREVVDEYGNPILGADGKMVDPVLDSAYYDFPKK